MEGCDVGWNSWTQMFPRVFEFPHYLRHFRNYTFPPPQTNEKGGRCPHPTITVAVTGGYGKLSMEILKNYISSNCVRLNIALLGRDQKKLEEAAAVLRAFHET